LPHLFCPENAFKRFYQVVQPDWDRPGNGGYSIYYGCEDGRFPMSASCGTFSNPDSLISSSKTGVNPGIRSWKKKHSSEWTQCHKDIGGIYPTKNWRAETLHPGLEFDDFKSRLKSGIFKCFSWLNSSCFGGNHRGFSKEDDTSYQMATINVAS
jgi:hypothetical protein